MADEKDKVEQVDEQATPEQKPVEKAADFSTGQKNSLHITTQDFHNSGHIDPTTTGIISC